MALLKKIIKSDPNEVIVKWTGSGTDTLYLSSLVSENQILTGILTPCVNILAASSSISGGSSASVVRNSEVVLNIHDNYEFQTDGIITAVLNENSNHDIIVNLDSIGTLILRLKKTQGYSIIS